MTVQPLIIFISASETNGALWLSWQVREAISGVAVGDHPFESRRFCLEQNEDKMFAMCLLHNAIEFSEGIAGTCVGDSVSLIETEFDRHGIPKDSLMALPRIDMAVCAEQIIKFLDFENMICFNKQNDENEFSAQLYFSLRKRFPIDFEPIDGLNPKLVGDPFSKYLFVVDNGLYPSFWFSSDGWSQVRGSLRIRHNTVYVFVDRRFSKINEFFFRHIHSPAQQMEIKTDIRWWNLKKLAVKHSFELLKKHCRDRSNTTVDWFDWDHDYDGHSPSVAPNDYYPGLVYVQLNTADKTGWNDVSTLVH